MVSVRRRKMRRSGVAKNTRKNSNNNKTKFNPKSNPVIAKHWDPKLTAKQNYKRLGLTFRLSAPSGGEEHKLRIREIPRGNMEESLLEQDEEVDEEVDEHDGEDDEAADPYDPANILEGTAKMVRDAQGNVVRIVYGTKKLEQEQEQDVAGGGGDDDEASGSDSDDTARQVIGELEQLASVPKKKEVRKMSDLEVHRYRRLIDTYGDDYERMRWDRRLNPFQLSPGQLRKKIAKYRLLYGDGEADSNGNSDSDSVRV